MKYIAEEIVEIDIPKIPCFCHGFHPEIPHRSYCGIPRQEQKPHTGWGRKFPVLDDVCGTCGLRICPRCKEAHHLKIQKEILGHR